MIDFASIPIISEKDENGNEIECRSELEFASFLSLVESKRKKGGAFFKKSSETISFISYVGWPFHLIKYDNNNSYLVFDSLNIFSHSIDFPLIPDADTFSQLLHSNQHTTKNPGVYIELLKSYQNVFKNFVNKTTHKINGFLNAKDLINDVLERTIVYPGSIPNKMYVLSHRLEQDQSENKLEQIYQLKDDAIRDHNKLVTVHNNMFEISDQWKPYLDYQISENESYFNSEINRILPDVRARIEEYQRLRSSEIHSVEMRFSRNISELQTKFSRYQSDEIRYLQMGERYLRKINDTRHQQNIIQNQINQLDREKNNSINKIQNHYDDLINKENQRIRILEDARDQKTAEYENMKSLIAKYTSIISGTLLDMIDKISKFTKMFDDMTVQPPLNISAKFGNSSFVVHIPMLVACLKTDKNLEWLVCPPMTFKKSKGVTDKLKGLISGIVLPLEPRTELLDKIIKKRFKEALDSDLSLSNELLTHCKGYDILENPDAKNKFGPGMDLIKEMKWFNEKQFHEIKSSIENQFKI